MVQHEICSLLEMLMRNKNKIEKMNKKGDSRKIWFFDLEDAIFYKF